MRCWYTRWRLSNALDRGDLAARRARGHAAACASCQAFARALETLDARLSRGVATAAVPVIPARPRRRLLIAAPLALGAAVVAIVVATSGSPVAPVSHGSGPAAPEATATAAAPVRVRVDQVADRVTRALGRTPLDAELDNLIADSKRGLDTVLAIGGLR